MKTTRTCHCGKTYEADERNLKRGWGLSCSKSCAAKKREENKISKPSKKKDMLPNSNTHRNR